MMGRENPPSKGGSTNGEAATGSWIAESPGEAVAISWKEGGAALLVMKSSVSVRAAMFMIKSMGGT